jgi:2-oxoglutarate ferredoxin oxidoreductase subunit delta
VTVSVNPKFCKGCSICVVFCPKQVLALDDLGKIYVQEPDNCIECGQCQLRCPDFAITVLKDVRGDKK